MRTNVLVAVLFGVCCGSVAAGVNTSPALVRAEKVNAAPGETVDVPIILELVPGTVVATLQFNLTLKAVEPGQELSGPVQFVPVEGGPAPSLAVLEGDRTVLVGWLSEIRPPLSGTTRIGILRVTVPANGQIGARYAVEVLSPSATRDGVASVPLQGVSGEVDVQR